MHLWRAHGKDFNRLRTVVAYQQANHRIGHIGGDDDEALDLGLDAAFEHGHEHGGIFDVEVADKQRGIIEGHLLGSEIGDE